MWLCSFCCPQRNYVTINKYLSRALARPKVGSRSTVGSGRSGSHRSNAGRIRQKNSRLGPNRGGGSGVSGGSGGGGPFNSFALCRRPKYGGAQGCKVFY